MQAYPQDPIRLVTLHAFIEAIDPNFGFSNFTLGNPETPIVASESLCYNGGLIVRMSENRGGGVSLNVVDGCSLYARSMGLFLLNLIYVVSRINHENPSETMKNLEASLRAAYERHNRYIIAIGSHRPHRYFVNYGITKGTSITSNPIEATVFETMADAKTYASSIRFIGDLTVLSLLESI